MTSSKEIIKENQAPIIVNTFPKELDDFLDENNERSNINYIILNQWLFGDLYYL
jgi:hypothetical protein